MPDATIPSDKLFNDLMRTPWCVFGRFGDAVSGLAIDEVASAAALTRQPGPVECRHAVTQQGGGHGDHP